MVALVLAAAMASPLAAMAWVVRCDGTCAAGESAVGAVVSDAAGAPACCSCVQDGANEKQRGGNEHNDDCRDCGCPQCAVHVAVVGIVWSGEAAVPAAEPCGLECGWPGTAPARGGLCDLMRPPRTSAA